MTPGDPVTCPTCGRPSPLEAHDANLVRSLVRRYFETVTSWRTA